MFDIVFDSLSLLAILDFKYYTMDFSNKFFQKLLILIFIFKERERKTKICKRLKIFTLKLLQHCKTH